MQENLLKNPAKNEIKSAEKYLIKYLQDLQKHFLLTNEELIALYFKQILREFEKTFILKEFEVISDDEQKKILVEDAIDILYNAETINHKLNEIITKQNEYLKFKRRIERAKQLGCVELKEFNPNSQSYEEGKKMIKRLITCQQRSQYNLFHFISK